jgi:hypothetical protein
MKSKPAQNSILPNYSNTGDIALKKQNTLRKIVGALGILLPLLVYLFLQFTNGFDPILPSISHYYFTRAASLFEIIVSLLAVFLLVYKGEELIDYILSSIAGFSALLMLLFPTSNLRGYNHTIRYDSVAVTFFGQSSFRPEFHYICASLFLLSLAVMALFVFTKSSHSPSQRTPNKRNRNRVYRTCGVVMLAAMCVAFLGFLDIIPATIYDGNNLTFWMETLSVEAFGVGWMVKGELILTDK